MGQLWVPLWGSRRSRRKNSVFRIHSCSWSLVPRLSFLSASQHCMLAWARACPYGTECRKENILEMLVMSQMGSAWNKNQDAGAPG